MTPIKSHSVNELDNFIMGFYSHDTSFCDELIDIFKKNEYNANSTGVYGSNIVDKSVKDSIDSTFHPDTLHWLQYGKVLNEATELYTKKYPMSACVGYTVQEPFAVQYYPPMGGYKIWHCERESADMMNVTRHLVFMTYLNDVEDDGETEFYHQKIKIKPEKGLTVIWPADWTFTHRGIVSKTQEKYIVTGWLNLLKEVK